MTWSGMVAMVTMIEEDKVQIAHQNRIGLGRILQWRKQQDYTKASFPDLIPILHTLIWESDITKQKISLGMIPNLTCSRKKHRYVQYTLLQACKRENHWRMYLALRSTDCWPHTQAFPRFSTFYAKNHFCMKDNVEKHGKTWVRGSKRLVHYMQSWYLTLEYVVVTCCTISDMCAPDSMK